MDDYCGSPFWNWTLSWNTNTQDPELTSCFQRTVLVWIPCVFLWILAPFEYRLIRRSTAKSIPWAFMNAMKCGFITTLLIFQIFELTYDLFYEFKGYDTPVVDKYTPISKLVTFCLALFLTVLNTNHGRRTSGILFIFWFLLLICEIPAFRTAIRNPKNHPTFKFRLPYVLELLYGPLVLALFLLNCWADSPPHFGEDTDHLHKCPEKSASFLSRLFFFWTEGLARKGYTKALEFRDLWELSPENTSKVLNPPFRHYWQELHGAGGGGDAAEVEERAAYRPGKGKGQDSVDVGYKAVGVGEKRSKPLSMAVILWRSYGGSLLFGSFLKLIQDLLSFVSPLILNLILDQIQEDKRMGREFEYWKDYFYVLILLAASVIGSLVGNQYMYRMNLIGLRIRTTVIGCLYRKALRISKASKEETSTGEIVNLMAVDAQRLTELAPYVTVIWSTPLIIGLSLHFLYGLLGAAVFAGLGTMVLLIPIQAFIGVKVKGFQTRQMKFKDTRIKTLNELLQGIKVLKLYAWEPFFEKQVSGVRESELKILRESVRTTAMAMFIWTSAPVVVAVVTFATFVWMDEGNVLDAQTAFVSLSLFNIMRLPLNLLPVMLVSLVQAGVGIKRINRYMNSPEVDYSAVTHNPKESQAIVIENGNFGWYEDLLTLKNINLSVRDGSLLGIVGVVGSGKSSLLAAMLGETRVLDGRVNRLGSLAYVAQEAWIQNATVRENILCDLPYDAELYEEVLEATALRPDLRVLPAGDKTEIGEKGINLSGGQRQRVALARAAYRQADIYLLDDPLSAVDSHVGKHIFERLLGSHGLLKDKTRVLVTHAVTFLPHMDQIVVIKDGSISESGSYEELIEKKGAFSDFLSQHAMAEVEDEVGKGDWSREENLWRLPPPPPNETDRRPSAELPKEFEESEALLGESIDDPLGLRRLIQDEEVETGNIKWGVVTYYLNVVGFPLALSALFLQLLFQICAVGSNVWLGVWASALNKTEEDGGHSRDTYLGVYALLCLGQGFFIFVATLVMAFGTLRASSFLHGKMLGRILRAPLSFFDTTPVGRIINRFSKDTEVTDNAVPMSLSSWLKCVLNVLAALAIIVYTTPGFVVVIIPTAVLYFLAQRFYVCTSRQLARLEAVTRSPIYSYFAETLGGASTIRAFGWEEAFVRRAERLVDSNQKCFFPSIVTTRYLTVFLESTGNVVVFFAFLFSVLYSDHLTTGMVGLALSYALQITHGLNWLVETTNNVENNLVAVERLKEFGEIQQEAPWEVAEKRPPNTWPKFGQVSFEKFQARYREGLELVLKGVSCRIEPGERVGICGRTGAGKSSLALSLFRIVEGAGGSILIDGKDIAEMGLHDLRRKLSIIPQDPVIFSGTLRSNLDPFSDYSDEELWRSLELAHLRPFIQGLPAGLEHELSEGGANLSVGQKQLICLSRALLRRNCKVLVLDEATAAIDLETDEFVQEAIRREFNTCTVLTIAHRLNTIMDYSRILVLDDGHLVEFDTPHNLLQNRNSVFHNLVKEARLI